MFDDTSHPFHFSFKTSHLTRKSPLNPPPAGTAGHMVEMTPGSLSEMYMRSDKKIRANSNKPLRLSHGSTPNSKSALCCNALSHSLTAHRKPARPASRLAGHRHPIPMPESQPRPAIGQSGNLPKEPSATIGPSRTRQSTGAPHAGHAKKECLPNEPSPISGHSRAALA